MKATRHIPSVGIGRNHTRSQSKAATRNETSDLVPRDSREQSKAEEVVSVFERFGRMMSVLNGTANDRAANDNSRTVLGEQSDLALATAIAGIGGAALFPEIMRDVASNHMSNSGSATISEDGTTTQLDLQRKSSKWGTTYNYSMTKNDNSTVYQVTREKHRLDEMVVVHDHATDTLTQEGTVTLPCSLSEFTKMLDRPEHPHKELWQEFQADVPSLLEERAKLERTQARRELPWYKRAFYSDPDGIESRYNDQMQAASKFEGEYPNPIALEDGNAALHRELYPKRPNLVLDIVSGLAGIKPR